MSATQDMDAASAAFFEGTAKGELRLPLCGDCGTFQPLTALICTSCLSHNLSWKATSGRGKVHSFGIMHQKFAGFEDKVPYNVAQVELDEGPRLGSAITGCADDAIRVGMAVTVTFEARADGTMLPKFRPA